MAKFNRGQGKQLPRGMGAASVPAMFRTIGTNLVPYAMHYRYGFFEGPDRQHLEKYEIAFRTDPIINRALDYIMRSMIASLGAYHHQDARAVRYVNQMLNEMEGNLHQQLGELIISALWSGVGVSEKIFEARNGKIWLKKLCNYHPRSINIVPNDRGELTEGEKILFHPRFERSGVWQELPWKHIADGKLTYGMKRQLHHNYVRLPLEKLVMVTHNKRHGNWEGESALAPVMLRYQMFLETWQNLMITTERYGSPQVAVTVPYGLTSQQIDLGNGQYRYKTVAEAAAEALQGLNSSSALVFEEPYGSTGTASEKIRIQPLSTFNNFGESFLATVKFLYTDVLIGLGVPPLLFLEHSEGLGGGAISKVHAETYKQLLIALYKEFVEPFCEQVIGQLLNWNFGITDPGKFIFTPLDIDAGNTLMATLGEANANGVLDMSEEEDLQFSRAVLGFPLASEESLARRIRNNKKLMEVVRRPETDKMKMQERNNQTALEQTNLTIKTQDKINKRQVDAQREIAEKNNQAKLKAEKEKTKAQQAQTDAIMSGKASEHEERVAQAQIAVKQADADAHERKAKAQIAVNKSRPKTSPTKKPLPKKK